MSVSRESSLREALRRPRTGIVFLAALVAALVAVGVLTSVQRFLDNDEYEHMHKAWLMRQGQLAWLSPTSVHTPMLEWVIAAFMQATGERTAIILVMRLFTLAVSCASMALVFIIARELYGSAKHGLLAVLLSMSTYVWMNKGLEVRPDNLMLFFALLSFLVLMRYYRDPSLRVLAGFGVCAVLSFLGKQNAVVFYAPVGAVWLGEALLRRRLASLRAVLGVMAALALIAQIPAVKTALVTVLFHLVPHPIRFSPVKYILRLWEYNRWPFVLFGLQVLVPMRLQPRYALFRVYLLAVPLTALGVLFIVNRPWTQEMLLMAVFMAIAAAGLVVDLAERLDWKLGYAVPLVVALPALMLQTHVSTARTMERQVAITRQVLEITKPGEMVLDSFGQPIFRPHPLDPDFVLYFPRRFHRQEELENRDVVCVVRDSCYFPLLPRVTRNWIATNFTALAENRAIMVRTAATNAPAPP